MNIAGTQGDAQDPSLANYIKLGEEQDVHKGYKCSIRSPWYFVPSTWIPDIFLFRQIYDFPRFVLNTTDATATDTVHRIKCHVNPKKMVENSFTYLTAASAEIEGRSYGGGVLALEPSEAGKLLMPGRLGDALPIEEVDQLIREGKLGQVLEKNNALLKQQLGLTDSECNTLKNIWMKMRNRRLSRKKKKG